MKPTGIELSQYTGEGYRPLVAFESWRVAVLNTDPGLLPERITHMQRHDRTDEVFVLLKGACTLILSDDADAPTALYGVRMQPGIAYTIKKGVWHTHTLAEDTSVLIIENDDTGEENSPSAPLPHPLDMAALPYPLES